jgi:hypothetical protein
MVIKTALIIQRLWLHESKPTSVHIHITQTSKTGQKKCGGVVVLAIYWMCIFASSEKTTKHEALVFDPPFIMRPA